MRYIFILLFICNICHGQETHFRINNAGYHPTDNKIAFVMSDQDIDDEVQLFNLGTNEIERTIALTEVTARKWGKYQFQYTLDFSDIAKTGKYQLKIGKHASENIYVSNNIYDDYHKVMLAFMRQQRCGYNPYFDMVCHQKDGRIFYAPVADSTYFDFSGGWHDAADQLKYLITGSNATARMLLAYELAPDIFKDKVDALGHPSPNQIPDILDEAKWGLDWILKLHPKQDWLIHQIADDRDHRGFKFPNKDNAEYGWGPNSFRAAYFANGKPQGLGKWKSKATGIANVAGRSAAALAIGARIWQKYDSGFAERCSDAAIELYHMGKQQEGYQQGNSYGAPYRYNEDSWEDDMEWAAVELYKLTEINTYLKDAIHYAKLIQDDGWMARDTMVHYQKYPFMNMGHFALFQVAPAEFKSQLSDWYRANIEKVLTRAKTNAYQNGVPFLWCSSNLTVNFTTQTLLYEKMTDDKSYRAAAQLHWDWLFGRNPWGTSMFTGLPEGSETPLDVHLVPRALMQQTPAGGLIDGPIFKSIHSYLKGLYLKEEDELADFQNDFVVYHDDIGDYSTNEPTMDGTADAIFLMALWSHMQTR